MKENRLINNQNRKPMQIGVGLCISIHGPREDSVEFMPVLFVAITSAIVK